MSGATSELANRCHGRWPSILAALGCGLSDKALAHKDVPCLTCGGTDRFRFTDKGFGRWYCRGCREGGDGVRLVERVKGVDFSEAARLIESVIGSSSSTWGTSSNDKPRDPLKPWREAMPLTRSTAGWRYFENRGLVLTDAETVPLRHRDAAWHWPTASTWPCVVALVRLHDGTELCAHQTFIKPDGSGKSPVERPRLFPKGGKTDGGGVWFGTPDSECEFVVAEGVESTLSAMRLLGLETGCAALSAGGINRLVLPPEVRWVRILADNDELGQGLAAAVAARRLWRGEGRQVAISHAKNVGEDANDLWRRRVEGRAHV
jgi:putative DNA primase/helicase